MIGALEQIRSFEPVCRAAESMRGFDGEWFVCGGWALDLFLGRVRRAHHDLEIAVFRKDQRELRRQLFSWSFEKIVQPNGHRQAWPADDWLVLPTHEIHGRTSTGQAIEFLLNERAGDRWVYRRDLRITLSIEQLSFCSPIGAPALAPEVVLLYKSKSPRPKDDADFIDVLPALGEAQRGWLREAIATIDARHSWLGRMS